MGVPVEETTRFTPHSKKQDIAIFSDKPITVAATGIQFGKTVIGAWRMKMAVHQSTDPRDAFLVCAPTYKIMLQSSLPAFLEIMRGFGTFAKGDMVFTVHTGQKVYFRTGTDPDSIVGVTRVKKVWGDECGLFSLYFWENMQARAAFMQAPITLTTSPYTLNWLYKEIIRPIVKDGPEARPDVCLIRARSDENPYFPKDYYEQKRMTMDPRRFQMMFGGEWSKFAGLVYDCFDEDENQCESFQFPTGTKFFAGVDWGTTNPFAICVRAVTPDGNHYQPCEVYETGLTITDMVSAARLLKQHYSIERFYCDPSQPGYIEEFNRAGLTAIGADNDIRHGIDIHYGMLRSRRLKLFRGRNKYTVDELETYRYPDDEDQRGPNQDHRERLPVKRDDHILDANRYVSVHTHRHDGVVAGIVAGEAVNKKHETYEQRLARLKSVKDFSLTEEW